MKPLRPPGAAQKPKAAWRQSSRGWAALLVCGLLVQGSALGVALVSRWAWERERQGWPLWAHAQAQALGQAGLMWTLARLEDTRPVDLQCRTLLGPAPTGATLESFAARMAAPGRTLRCTVDLNEGTVVNAWSCDCSATAATRAWPSVGDAAQGRLEFDFSGTSSALRLRLKAQVLRASDQGPVWQESLGLQADSRFIWRAVLGTWQDAR
ncbi:MAG: hypothetical protein EBV28_04130 [Betaproteobacteria bacterium]|nr:hypothetical protein [Betaproteobacteria bacterium]